VSGPVVPELSVIVVTPNHYEAIRKTIRCLVAQTARDRLEVVIVAPSAGALGKDGLELRGFARSVVVEIGEVTSTGAAIAAGVHRASAPVVAYAEEHTYPDPRWAEALIRAHRHGWVAVGAMVANANPGSLTSWANLLTDFGPWVEPSPARESATLASHHTAYDRAVLLEYGAELAAMLETEAVLHRDLRARGRRLYFEPAARSRHVNVSRLRSYVRAEFQGGRLFGAMRARQERWSRARRLLYVGAMPLIPLVRLSRLLPELWRPGRPRALLVRLLPPLCLGLVAHTLGEAAGYSLGAGDAARRRVDFELHRHRHLSDRDRRLSMSPAGS
jgi:hypothetical protein